MKVLVIPDVHLKPWMFERADKIIEQGAAERAVCLMDIPDDWNQEYNLELYKETFDAAIAFAKKYPETLWAHGNHDLSYIWNEMESGYSPAAAYTVAMKLDELACALPEGNEIRYIQKIDNVLFCHGGLWDYSVKKVVPKEKYHDVDEVVRIINGLPREYMWSDVSPIWHRPQYTAGKMYGDEKILQVVGHTPVEKIYREGNVISCDVFSTYRDGKAIGTEEFLVVDTESWEYGGVKAKKNLDIAEIQNTLLKQMEDYLEGLISKEKYAEDAEQFYSKYGYCIEETEFDEVFSEAIPDCCIVNVDEPGDEDLKEKDFHEIMADTYQKLKGLVDS